MKKSIIAVVVAGIAVGSFWFYTHNAQAEEATTASATEAVLGGKHGKPGKGENKAQRGEGGPLFKAAESVNGLNAEQKAKLDGLKADFNAKMKEMHKDNAGAPDSGDKKQARKEMRGKMQSLNDGTKVQIEAVLSEDQKKEFATKLQAQIQEMKDKKPSGTATK